MRGCGRISNKWFTLRDPFIEATHSVLPIEMTHGTRRFAAHSMFRLKEFLEGYEEDYYIKWRGEK